MPTAWPPARNVIVEAVHAARLRIDGAGHRPRPAGHRETVLQAPAELDDLRPALDEPRDPCGAGQAMRDDAERQPDAQQRHEGRAQQDRARDEPADTQDQDRHGRDDHDHDGVHDALDRDRAQDRRAAQALALAQRVRADELPEARRQDVVGEVSLVGVAEDPAVGDHGDRGQQDAPSGRPGAHVDQHRHEHDADPGGGRGPEHLPRLGKVDRAQHDVDRHDADRDAQRAPEQGLRTDPHAVVGPTVSRRGRGSAASGSAGRATDGACIGRPPEASRGRRRRCA